jgi:sensor histidine kinase regulating citrate/malate metabolism
VRGTLPCVRIPAFASGRRQGETSLAARLLVLQAVVLLVVVLTSSAVAYADARSDVRRSAEQRTTAIVDSLITSPLVLEAVTGSDPTAVLQPYVERIRAETGTSFITVLAPDRTRFTHPDPPRSAVPSRAPSRLPWPGRRSPRPTPARWGRPCERPAR